MKHLETIEPHVASSQDKLLEFNKIAEKSILVGNLKDAEDSLNSALRLIENQSVDHPLLVAMTYTNFGSLKCQLRCFQEALNCFEKVLEYTEGHSVDALLCLKFCTAYSGDRYIF